MLEAKGGRDFPEIGERNVALRPAADLYAVEEVAVGLENRNVAAVVEQEDFHRQAVARDRLQLLDVHHDAAVARQRDHAPLIVAGGTDADGCGQVVAHRRAAGITPVPLALLQLTRLESDDASRGIGRDDDIVGVERVKDGLHRHIGVAWLVILIFVENDREFAFALKRPVDPLPMRVGGAIIVGGEHRRDEVLEVGDDGEVRLDVRPLELDRIHIDPDLVGGAREGRPIVADLADIEPAAEHQQEVRTLRDHVAAAIANRAGASGVERMLFPDIVAAVEAGDDGDAELVDQLQECLVVPAQPNAAAGENHRPLRLLQPGEDVAHGGLDVGFAPRLVDLGGVEALQSLGIDHCRLNVERDVQPARTRPAAGGQVNGLFQMVAD